MVTVVSNCRRSQTNNSLQVHQCGHGDVNPTIFGLSAGRPGRGWGRGLGSFRHKLTMATPTEVTRKAAASEHFYCSDLTVGCQSALG